MPPVAKLHKSYVILILYILQLKEKDSSIPLTRMKKNKI